MFDFHMHSKVSFDGREDAAGMVKAAEAAGLREICFTDHLDFEPLVREQTMLFTPDTYRSTYQDLRSDAVTIRRGVELGLLPDNRAQLQPYLKSCPFDFIIGSVHFAEDLDIYYPPYWEGKTQDQAERSYLEAVLACVQHHSDFHVLGHLTYISKAWANPAKRPVPLDQNRELVDQILRTLVSKGKGMEINTSGIKSCGDFLPGAAYLRRFKELGGEIITVGSDAHDGKRVGEHCFDACRLAQEIFGHVCTFARGEPIFHRL